MSCLTLSFRLSRRLLASTLLPLMVIACERAPVHKTACVFSSDEATITCKVEGFDDGTAKGITINCMDLTVVTCDSVVVEQ